jgi:hypothetical protein
MNRIKNGLAGPLPAMGDSLPFPFPWVKKGDVI